MSAELSQIIIDLQKQGTAVVHSGKTHAQRVAEDFHARWKAQQEARPPTADESPPEPDIEGFVHGVVAMVEHDLGGLVAIDEAHVVELADDREKRLARDRALSEVSTMLSGIQGAVTSVHGEEASRKLFGHATELPTEPTKVYRLGRRVHKNVESGATDLSEARLAGWSPPNQEELAKALQLKVNRLGLALAGVGLEGRASEDSLMDKHRAIEGYRRTIRQTAACLGGLYRLAGLDELADRILPKRRAPRRRAGSGGEDGSTSPADAGTPEPSSAESASAETAEPTGERPTGSPPSGPIGIVS